jgi:hypothetical protein
MLSFALATAGCQGNPYLERRETISYMAGDAVAVNRAIHTIDPWPVESADTTIPVSGRKVVDAIERYHKPPKDAATPSPLAVVPLASTPLNGAPN